MEKLGILKYTKELKRVLIDFIREKKSGNVSGKIPLGVIAAYGQGYDTWISWNEKENSLFISKFKGDISEIHAKIKKLFPHVEATIRGAMIVVSPSKRDPNAPMVTTEQLIEALGLKKEVSKEGGGNTALEKEFAEVSVKIKTLDMEIHKIDESIGEENKEIARIQARLDEITEERKKFGKEIESRKPQSIDIEGLREEINTILLKELRAEGGKLTKAPKVVLIENGYNISAQAMVTKFFQNITIDMYIELRNKNEGIDVVYKINADKYEDRVKDKIGPSFNQLVPKMKEYFSNKYKKEVDTMKIVNGNLVLQFK